MRFESLRKTQKTTKGLIRKEEGVPKKKKKKKAQKTQAQRGDALEEKLGSSVSRTEKKRAARKGERQNDQSKEVANLIGKGGEIQRLAVRRALKGVQGGERP